MGKVREYKGTPGSDRRAFLRQMKNLGIASAAAVVWGGIANSSKASIPILRPPGAMPERQFLKSCIKCGLCVEVCPYHALQLAAPGDQRPIGTPYFLPRQQPCRMCMDVPCVPVCPTGAISLARIEHDTAGGTQSPDINCARMGLAVISRDTCVAYWGIQCDACYRVCPLMDKPSPLSSRAMTEPANMLFWRRSCTAMPVLGVACVSMPASRRRHPFLFFHGISPWGNPMPGI